MLIISLPAILYGILHLIGYYYPAYFWGVDQLYYYPTSVTVSFFLVLAVLVVLSARSSWALRLERIFAALLQSLAQRSFFGSIGFKGTLAFLFALIAFFFRDRQHLLGDSAMWIRNLELLVNDSSPREITWVFGIDIPGFEHIPALQPLDFFIHLQAHRIGHSLFGWSSAFAYEWISCAAGGLYVLFLWRIVSLLFDALPERITFLLLGITLGSAQFFFGYGESYTLVHLAATAYALYGLRTLQGGSLLSSLLCLLLASALHVMALSLFPSWLFLAWHRGYLRSRFAPHLRLILPVLAALAVLCYLLFPYKMPLWTPESEGRYALFSWPHLMTLINVLLLLSPFGIVWGVASLRRRREADPQRFFLGWAALGAGGLVFITEADMGGRDWDLMAFPCLFYSFWGVLSLRQSPNFAACVRGIRLVIVPLMALHTALWIGTNISSERAVNRLGNILQHTGLMRYYQAYTLGHYHLNIRQEDYQQAARYFREAIHYAPEGNAELINRFYKNLGKALVLSREYAEAIQAFEKAYATQEDPFQFDFDQGFHLRWASAYFDLATEVRAQGDAATASGLLDSAVAKSRQLVRSSPNPLAFELLGRALEETGSLSEAAAAYQRGIEMQQDRHHLSELYVNLGIVHEKLGKPRQAAAAYEQAIRFRPGDLKLRYLLGMFYLNLGDVKAAARVQAALEQLDGDLAAKLAVGIADASR